MPRPMPFPTLPAPDDSLLIMKAKLGAILEWTLAQRVGQLKAAGFTDDEFMKLRVAAVRYQKGTAGFEEVSLVREILPKLGTVHIFV